uniref:Uncharacterized protein n=1 Tax=Arundo donax TaxID=35708 RepID=A0A0A8Y7P6_ARUDO
MLAVWREKAYCVIRI